MSHPTMRAYLGVLEQRGLLRRIAKPVDPTWEPAALVKWMYQALPEKQRFGMWFDHVIGSDIPLVIGALGANTASYATALGTDVDGINAAWVAAFRKLVPPKVVDTAPCQQVVLTGSDVRLSYLPIPVWTPGKDKGRYITTNTITKDFDTGIQNMGVYRTWVRDETTVVSNLNRGHQGYINTLTWTDKMKVAPIAWVIAAPPAVQLAAVAQLPYGVDEITLAGGLMEAPVHMVKAKTVDLLVPAEAEIIIEGEIHPDDTDMEGPFGEMAGYMGPVARRPVVRITAITHRKDPIYYGYSSQMPPSESTTIQSLTNAGLVLKTLRYDLGEDAVTDIFVDLTFGGMLGHAIVAMKPKYPAHSKKVARVIAAIMPVKRVTMVDTDIDIRDHTHVEWAMNARYNPARDTILVEDVFFPPHLDPSRRTNSSHEDKGSKVICDATLKAELGTFSLPPKQVMMDALEVWKNVGLPEFEIPKRVKLRMDGS